MKMKIDKLKNKIQELKELQKVMEELREKQRKLDKEIDALVKDALDKFFDNYYPPTFYGLEEKIIRIENGTNIGE